MYKIQSILFDKDIYTKNEALHFLKNHGLKYSKIDETERFYRFRQIDPYYLARQGYNVPRTKKIVNGIEYIIYYKEHKGTGIDEGTTFLISLASTVGSVAVLYCLKQLYRRYRNNVEVANIIEDDIESVESSLHSSVSSSVSSNSSTASTADMSDVMTIVENIVANQLNNI